MVLVVLADQEVTPVTLAHKVMLVTQGITELAALEVQVALPVMAAVVGSVGLDRLALATAALVMLVIPADRQVVPSAPVGVQVVLQAAELADVEALTVASISAVMVMVAAAVAVELEALATQAALAALARTETQVILELQGQVLHPVALVALVALVRTATQAIQAQPVRELVQVVPHLRHGLTKLGQMVTQEIQVLQVPVQVQVVLRPQPGLTKLGQTVTQEIQGRLVQVQVQVEPRLRTGLAV